jgi:hypothetical protein
VRPCGRATGGCGSGSSLTLEKVLWKQQYLYNRQSEGQNNHQCEVIADTSLRSINTGVLILNATEQTRKLVESWYQLQLYHGFCWGPADHLAFEEVFLEQYGIEDYALEECLKYEVKYFNTRRTCAMSRLNDHKKMSLDELQLRMMTPKNEHNTV